MERFQYKFFILDRPTGFYVSIRHTNGQPIYTSEAYTTRHAAMDSLISFLNGVADRFDPANPDNEAAILSYVVNEPQP
jgi:uncharacterized protein YegP (UPF0339 family)